MAEVENNIVPRIRFKFDFVAEQFFPNGTPAPHSLLHPKSIIIIGSSGLMVMLKWVEYGCGRAATLATAAVVTTKRIEL